jgi:preprotein translocase subunit SecA
MYHLRQGIHLRGYAQKNPKQEYKRESFELFSSMLEQLKAEVTNVLCRVQVRAEEDVTAVEEQRRKADAAPKEYQHESANQLDEPEDSKSVIRTEAKVGRNDPCPCGSGKKYKQCHGKLS